MQMILIRHGSNLQDLKRRATEKTFQLNDKNTFLGFDLRTCEV